MKSFLVILVAALSLATALPTPVTDSDLTVPSVQDNEPYPGFPSVAEQKEWSDKLVGKYFVGHRVIPEGMMRNQVILAEDLPRRYRALHRYDFRSTDFIPSRMDLNLVDYSQYVESVTWG